MRARTVQMRYMRYVFKSIFQKEKTYFKTKNDKNIVYF